MMCLRQAVIAVACGCLGAGPLRAGDEAAFDYEPPQTEPSRFDERLGMLDRERGEYATHLATFAANLVAESEASEVSLTEARRLLALALHRSPRNRKALVVNYQLRSGILPEPTPGDYSAGVLARLLATRAELLQREGGAQNELLARCFVELAARMDPRNEDAVYAAELQRLDHGELDWGQLTDARAAAKEPGEKIPPPADPAPAPSAPQPPIAREDDR